MPSPRDISKKPYSLRRLMWIGVAAVTTFCACLAFLAFANRDNPSAVPTIHVQDPGTALHGISPSATPIRDGRVELTLDIGLHANILTLHGTTNLPNHTILLYKVTQASPNAMPTDGSTAVMDGEYTAQVDLTGWPPGNIDVWVVFQILLDNNRKQPQAVTDRYGEMGEYLHGENVTETGGFKRVEVHQAVAILP